MASATGNSGIVKLVTDGGTLATVAEVRSFNIDETADTGDILLQKRVIISKNDTAYSLFNKLLKKENWDFISITNY